MRLWSLHPRHLDRQGLTAGWREGLLAQAVLAGRTRGYRNHPQLQRFRECPDPMTAISAYLEGVLAEAAARGYSYDATKVERPGAAATHPPIDVTDGQLRHEWAHLRAKLATRSPDRLALLPAEPSPHPLFRVVPGPVAAWEVLSDRVDPADGA